MARPVQFPQLQQDSPLPQRLVAEERPGSHLSTGELGPYGFSPPAQGPRICGPMDVDVDVRLLSGTSKMGLPKISPHFQAEQSSPHIAYASMAPTLEGDAYAQFQLTKEGISPFIRGLRNIFVASSEQYRRTAFFVQNPDSHDFKGLRGAPFRNDTRLGQMMAAIYPGASAYAKSPAEHVEDFQRMRQTFNRYAEGFGTVDKFFRISANGLTVAKLVEDWEWNRKNAAALSLVALDGAQLVQSARASALYVRADALLKPNLPISDAAAEFAAASRRLYTKVSAIQLASGVIRLVVEFSSDQPANPTSVTYATLDVAQGAAGVAREVTLGVEAARAVGNAEKVRVLMEVARVGDKLKISMGVLQGVGSVFTIGLSIYTYCEVDDIPNLDPKIKSKLKRNSVFGIFSGAAGLGSSICAILGMATPAGWLLAAAIVIGGVGFIWDKTSDD